MQILMSATPGEVVSEVVGGQKYKKYVDVTTVCTSVIPITYVLTAVVRCN